MRLVHLSDLHLGYRQYQRLTPSGINQREADVARSFESAIDRIIALDRTPDLVLIAGDVFHSVRPTNTAIVHAFLQFGRLRAALPDADVVMIAGDHDSPRTTETGSILRLFHELGIHVATSESQRFYFPNRDLAVLAVPGSFAPRPALVPDAKARYNVLMLHGVIRGIVPAHIAAASPNSQELTREELGAGRWSYIALGHHHVCTEVYPNAYYSGAIDYTSLDTWGELYEDTAARTKGKGFIEYDLDTGSRKFHGPTSSRPLVDLPHISARGLTASEVDARIRAAIDHCPGGIDDKIVRVIVRDIPRHIARELDHRAIRDYRRRALHFHLDTRRPEIARQHGQAAPGRRPTLADVVKQNLESRVLESDIDRKELVALGLKYLEEAETGPTPAPALLEGGLGLEEGG